MRVYESLQKYLHQRWCEKQKKRLKNSNFTIICNNCVGGIIYHDLGMRFDSPTINLTVKEYATFVEHFEHYIKCKLIQDISDEDSSYPRGILKSEKYSDIHLLFNHYHSFDEAKEKWEERCKRIHFENLFFLMECYDDMYPEELAAFCKLPYTSNRIVLTHTPHPEIRNAVTISCYQDEFEWGKILKQKRLSGKRYLDEFDYVAFLNRELL